MANMASDDESLESLLNKATNPASRDEDWDAIMAFCDRVNKELEGPQISVRLLAHKIQSPQEREALYALTVLESCVKNCGKRFHQEIGKFRFLNEMIKVVSPKYLGAHTTEKMKKKCVEIMYSWTIGLKHESKIVEAYSMLKRQGIVTEDPTYVEQTYEPPVNDTEKRATFEDEEKSKLLARLLKSKNAEDLQAANRLIKNMVKQDAERMDKVSKRVTELETVGNNIKLLAEMLQHYSPQASSDGERDLMKELYDNLEKERPKLFRLASDTDENDAEGINEILRVNDSVLKIMIEFKKIVEGISEENGIGTLTSSPSKGNASSLLDLELGAPTSQTPVPMGQQTSSSIVDDQLLSLGLSTANGETNASNMDALGDLFGATPAPAPAANKEDLLESLLGGSTPTVVPGMPGQVGGAMGIGTNPVMGGNFSQTATNIPPSAAPTQGSASVLLMNSQQPGLTGILPTPATNLVTGILPQPSVGAIPAPPSTTQTTQQHPMTQQQKSALDDLDQLGQSLLQQSLPLEQTTQPNFPVQQPPVAKVPMNQMPLQPLVPANVPVSSGVPLKNFTGPGSQMLDGSSTASPKKTPQTIEIQPLTDIFVPLETVKPGTVQPLTLYDKSGIKIVLHFGKDTPRPDVLVMVVSIMSTNESPVTKCTFQAAVPKMMKVKLQPPSATDLPGYNPILPPTAITQVMLIANPHKERIRLKFKLTYNTNNGPQSDVGEEDNFPVQ